ncbi:FecR family protein [Mucilaginibacter paludis]|uniref:Anti-FecI sigma factor, FecR n=1 Tax=Mucilaginibacter paludis DSM 18603 TaxID=714943 RepID=H1YA52_9SPHI|nr:FecR family protein [Mucilaginibacter paludis]EHQ25933.1 anti-FecI sigma factor, FecR [Mucilaginibacter paludis DSM 18603]
MEQKYAPGELIKKYNEGTCSEEEKAIVESWHLNDLAESTFVPSEESIRSLNTKMRQTIIAHSQSAPIVRKLWPRIAAAASILLFLSVGAYLYFNKAETKQQTAQNQIQDITPGTNKATITLANGKQIVLTDAKTGLLANQGSAAINKTADGQVIYNASKASPTGRDLEGATYNTMSTPRGGQHGLILSDGTKVWLDAASSITFPVAFTGKDRSVKITGQVYFEVVHNAAQPFRVTVKGQTIEDLGTHFNISAYDDEPAVITTLIEGSVQVATGEQVALLQPGEEALVGNGTHKIAVHQANVQQAIAWKDGLFRFNQTELKTIMRQISRWYDLDVIYEGNVVNDAFDGQIPRDVKLSQLLKILASNQIHFQVENRGNSKTLVIKP